MKCIAEINTFGIVSETICQVFQTVYTFFSLQRDFCEDLVYNKNITELFETYVTLCNGVACSDNVNCQIVRCKVLWTDANTSDESLFVPVCNNIFEWLATLDEYCRSVVILGNSFAIGSCSGNTCDEQNCCLNQCNNIQNFNLRCDRIGNFWNQTDYCNDLCDPNTVHESFSCGNVDCDATLCQIPICADNLLQSANYVGTTVCGSNEIFYNTLFDFCAAQLNDSTLSSILCGFPNACATNTAC